MFVIRTKDVTGFTCWIAEGEQRQMHPLTQGIALVLGLIQMHGITEENFPEVCTRLAVYQKYRGPALGGPDGPIRITPDHIYKHIGLTANWTFVDLDRAEFYRSLMVVDACDAKLKAERFQAAKS